MEVAKQVIYIDHFLKELYNASFPTSLAMGLEMKQLPSKENRENFKTLELILEELELVELVRGGGNSTLDGQSEYWISLKGRELVENNKSSLNLLLKRQMDKEKADNPLYDEKEWEKYDNITLEKRADQADFFLDMMIEKGLTKLDKPTIRKYFIEWFKESQEFDLQIKDGDFAFEDGDFQDIPDFSDENIPEFIKWFEERGNKFIDFLKEKGVSMDKDTKQEIVNHGNIVINQGNKIKKQSNFNNTGEKDTFWTKANVIIAAIGVLATIAAVLWQIYG